MRIILSILFAILPLFLFAIKHINEDRKIFKTEREWKYNVVFEDAKGKTTETATLVLKVENQPEMMGQIPITYHFDFSDGKSLQHPELAVESVIGPGQGAGKGGIIPPGLDEDEILELIDSLKKGYLIQEQGVEDNENINSFPSLHMITLKPPRAERFLFTQYAPFPVVNFNGIKNNPKIGDEVGSSTMRIMHPSLRPATSNITSRFIGYNNIKLPIGRLKGLYSVESIGKVQFSPQESETYITRFYFDEHLGFCKIIWEKPDGSKIIMELTEVNF